MIDAINRYIAYFVRPANQPILWLDQVIRRCKPTFQTSVALNLSYSLA